MKTTLIGIIVFLSMTTFVSAKNRKEAMKCGKQDTALSISGRFTDWNLPLRSNKSSGFYYGITNDDQNLYVEVKMEDETLIRKAVALGFKIWIDPDGKGKQVLGINYPQSRMHQLMAHHEHHQDQGQQPSRELTQAEIKKQREEMIQKFNLRYLTGQETGKLINFEKEGFKDAFFGQGDINAMIQMDQKGEIVYEAVIPLKSIFKKGAEYLSKDKPFSLILETGSFEPQATASRMYGGIAGGENARQMEEEGYGGGGYIGQGVNGAGGRMHQWGNSLQGMIQPARLKLKRVVLYQFK